MSTICRAALFWPCELYLRRVLHDLILAALLFVLGLAIDTGSAVSGDILDEVRLGIAAHNVEASPGESGIDITGELLLVPLGGRGNGSFAEQLLRPRPTIGFAWNTGGDTSQLTFGLTWHVDLTDRWFVEAMFGGAVHDGPLNQPGVTSYGCRANFRESASLGLELTERWRLLVGVSHMSNANLCKPNRGLTNIGLSLGYVLN